MRDEPRARHDDEARLLRGRPARGEKDVRAQAVVGRPQRAIDVALRFEILERVGQIGVRLARERFRCQLHGLR